MNFQNIFHLRLVKYVFLNIVNLENLQFVRGVLLPGAPNKVPLFANNLNLKKTILMKSVPILCQ